MSPLFLEPPNGSATYDEARGDTIQTYSYRAFPSRRGVLFPPASPDTTPGGFPATPRKLAIGTGAVGGAPRKFATRAGASGGAPRTSAARVGTPGDTPRTSAARHRPPPAPSQTSAARRGGVGDT